MMRKRWMAIVLSLLLVVGLFPVTVPADGFQTEQGQEADSGFTAVGETESGSSSDLPLPRGFSADEQVAGGFTAEEAERKDGGNLRTEDQIPYLVFDSGQNTFVERNAPGSIQEIDTNSTVWGGPKGEAWYIARDVIEITEPVTVSGNVYLILENGCNLSVESDTTENAMFTIAEGSSLTIYSQSTETENAGNFSVKFTGTTAECGAVTVSATANLTVHGGNINASTASIYRGYPIHNAGTINVYGGTVNCRNESTSTEEQKSGIDNTCEMFIHGGTVNVTSQNGNAVDNSGAVTIYGGLVTTYSGNSYGFSHSGGQLKIHGGTVEFRGVSTGLYNKGTLEITGGNVTIVGDTSHGVWIYDFSSEFKITGGNVTVKGDTNGIRNSGLLEITGGSVNVTGQCRKSGGSSYAGINNTSRVKITGGVVNVTGMEDVGIYSSSTLEITDSIVTVTGQGSGIEIKITGDSTPFLITRALVDANATDANDTDTPISGTYISSDSLVMEGKEGTVTGTYRLTQDWTLETGKTLNVPECSTMIVAEEVAFTVDGTLNINAGGILELEKNSVLSSSKDYFEDVKSEIINNGTLRRNDSSEISQWIKMSGEGTTEWMISGVSLDSSVLSLTLGSSRQLTASLLPDGAVSSQVVWSSDNPSVATVEATGARYTAAVHAHAVGTAVITVEVDEQYKASCTVTVTNPYYPVTGLTLDRTALTLEKGDSVGLQATVTPSYATNPTVTWSSSDPTVAIVSSSGTITGVGGGTAVITAQAGSNSAACMVTVTVPATGITLDQASLELSMGGQGTLTASLTPADATAQQILWSSSNPSVVAVKAGSADTAATGTGASTAIVTAIGKGSAVITATTEDGAFSAACTVTVPRIPSDTSLRVSGRTSGSVSLAWDPVEEAEGYTIWYRSEYETEVTRKIIWDGDTTSWTKTGLEPGTKYFFAIRAWVTDANGKYVFSEVSPTQRGTTKPEAAVIQSVTVTNGYVKVRLAGEAEGARRYSICYAESRNGFDGNHFQVGIRTSYPVRTMTPKLEPGIYYISVKSYRDLGNNKRVYGDWSNMVRVTVR